MDIGPNTSNRQNISLNENIGIGGSNISVSAEISAGRIYLHRSNPSCWHPTNMRLEKFQNCFVWQNLLSDKCYSSWLKRTTDFYGNASWPHLFCKWNYLKVPFLHALHISYMIRSLHFWCLLPRYYGEGGGNKNFKDLITSTWAIANIWF